MAPIGEVTGAAPAAPIGEVEGASPAAPIGEVGGASPVAPIVEVGAGWHGPLGASSEEGMGPVDRTGFTSKTGSVPPLGRGKTDQNTSKVYIKHERLNYGIPK